MQSNKTVEEFITKQAQWKEALIYLRKVLLETELVETIKWGIPVYTVDGKNVVGMGSFKAYIYMWFFQGLFLSYPNKVLVNAQDGKTTGMRQLRFSSMEEIDDDAARLYVVEAIQNQKDGKEIKPDKKKTPIIPDALKAKFEQDANLKESFESLKLGKQRDYTEYFEMA